MIIWKKVIPISDLQLTWFYDSDDEDILESGKELRNYAKIKFDICWKVKTEL